jgi:hypothetical protein
MKRVVALLPVLFALQVGVQPALAWTWPVDGPVLRPFVLGDDPYAAGQHRGIDVGGAAGAPVRAAAGGIVSFAGTVPGGGRTVTIQTADGYSVTLVHLGSFTVARGSLVAEGDIVGSVGPSGEPELAEPYVHLGVRLTADPNGYLDPLRFLPVRAAASGPAPEQEPAPVVQPAADEAAQGAGPNGEPAPAAEEQPTAPDETSTLADAPAEVVVPELGQLGVAEEVAVEEQPTPLEEPVVEAAPSPGVGLAEAIVPELGAHDVEEEPTVVDGPVLEEAPAPGVAPSGESTPAVEELPVLTDTPAPALTPGEEVGPAPQHESAPVEVPAPGAAPAEEVATASEVAPVLEEQPLIVEDPSPALTPAEEVGPVLQEEPVLVDAPAPGAAPPEEVAPVLGEQPTLGETPAAENDGVSEAPPAENADATASHAGDGAGVGAKPPVRHAIALHAPVGRSFLTSAPRRVETSLPTVERKTLVPTAASRTRVGSFETAPVPAEQRAARGFQLRVAGGGAENGQGGIGAGSLLAALAAMLALGGGVGLAVLRRQLRNAAPAYGSAPILLDGAGFPAEDAGRAGLAEHDRLVLDRDLEWVLLGQAKPLADFDGDHDPTELVDLPDDPGRRSSCRVQRRAHGGHVPRSRRLTGRRSHRPSVPVRLDSLSVPNAFHSKTGRRSRIGASV